MRRVVIESPYAGEIRRNKTYARVALLHSLQQGEAPFASHLLYTQVYRDADPRERARGIQAGYEWMALCDLVAFYIDYGWSAGMLKALRVARSLYSKETEVRSLYGNPTDYPVV